jgi:hypothetical protein
MTAFIELCVNLFVAYLGFGFLFAIVFVAKGIGRVDPVARGSSLGFRLIVLPGVAALWPLLLVRLIQGGRET